MATSMQPDEELDALADEHRRWLSSFDAQYLLNWEKLYAADYEAAMTEASIRRIGAAGNRCPGMDQSPVAVRRYKPLASARSRPMLHRAFSSVGDYYRHGPYGCYVRECRSAGSMPLDLVGAAAGTGGSIGAAVAGSSGMASFSELCLREKTVGARPSRCGR